jgi:hypothetical protein
MIRVSPLGDAENSLYPVFIEVAAATALIALLIFLALTNDTPYIYKAKAAEGYGLARVFQIEAELFYAHHGDWSINDAISDVGQYVQDMQLQNGVITLRYRNTHGFNSRGLSTDDALSLRPTVKTGSELPATVFWSCGYAAPKAGFTPHGDNQTTIPPDYLTFVCR